MDPKTPLENLSGVGSIYARKLNRLGIYTAEDLIYHFPFRYDDFSKISSISNALPNEKLSITGIIWQIRNIRTKNSKFITSATIADKSATIEVIWFNQPYLTKILKPGLEISLSGKVELSGNKQKLISPSYEILKSNGKRLTLGDKQTLHTARLVPIYPETEGLSSKWIRAKIASILPNYLKSLKDYLPANILKHQKIENLNSALSKIHFPKNYQDVENARNRLAFDELFLIQITTQLRKKQWLEEKTAPVMQIREEKFSRFIKNLPFAITSAQKRAIDEILADLRKERPANRLLEGDVGSGKTVVAASAALVAYENNYDTLLAAPTEILAFQHQRTLKEILSPLGLKIGIWTKSKKEQGNIICGTHALLTSFQAKRQVGLIVVDEQHRFGVAQRAKLYLDQKDKITPHLLTMTATPIPRTLALTLYGDLDLSILDEMPRGRLKTATYVVPNSKRNNAYKFIEKEIVSQRQVFIITPFVEPSESMVSVKAATDEFEKLKTKFSKKIKLGLLHGKLKSNEKQKIITYFRENKINILVSTPVVEVGIDVPNATIMLIESAERFGLAQLHQLRGRVGRGEYKSYCFLFTDSKSETSIKRLKCMEKIHVGSELAEIDLKIRGAGEIFGLKQSGFFNFKIADISNRQLISQTQLEAQKIIEKDPTLKKHSLLAQKIANLKHHLSQPN